MDNMSVRTDRVQLVRTVVLKSRLPCVILPSCLVLLAPVPPFLTRMVLPLISMTLRLIRIARTFWLLPGVMPGLSRP